MYTGNKSFNLRRKPLPKSFFKKNEVEVEAKEVKVEQPKPAFPGAPKKKAEKKEEEEQ